MRMGGEVPPELKAYAALFMLGSHGRFSAPTVTHVSGGADDGEGVGDGNGVGGSDALRVWVGDGDGEGEAATPPIAGTIALMETSLVHAPAPVAAVKPTVAVALPSTAAMSTASVCA